MSLEEYIKFSRSGKEGKSILTLRIPENKTAGNPSEWLVSYFSNIEALPENVSTAGQWFVLWSPLPCCCTTANCLKAGIISLWSVITQLPTQYLEHSRHSKCLRGMSVQFSHSVVSDSLRPHEQQHARPPLSTTNSWSLPKLVSIESVMPSSHLILCRPLLLPSIFPSMCLCSKRSDLAIWVLLVLLLSGAWCTVN